MEVRKSIRKKSSQVTEWPSGTQLKNSQNQPTLIVFGHPKCACTRATLRELLFIMSRVQSKVEAQVVFFRPEGFPETWEKTELWNKASKIPGVSVSTDIGGTEARKFGATTSGQTFLFSKSGKIIFSGGITPSRGHEGDNVGRNAILAALLDGVEKTKVSRVFGCSLNSEGVEREL
jgi:hypothetical protein